MAQPLPLPAPTPLPEPAPLDAARIETVIDAVCYFGILGIGVGMPIVFGLYGVLFR